VKKLQWIAVVACGLTFGVCVAATPAAAQTNVVVVDIGVLFEKHPGFQSELEKLRREADDLQKSVMSTRQRLQADAEALNLTYSPTSAEFKQKEREIALQATQLDIDAKDRMQSLMTREAHIHYDTYNEINRYLEDFCREGNLQLVLRYSGTSMDPKDPESIMTAVNSAIVFHRPDKNITDAVLQKMLQTKGVGGK
jgi:Skp family chaperone for outer membrane proteins